MAVQGMCPSIFDCCGSAGNVFHLSLTVVAVQGMSLTVVASIFDCCGSAGNVFIYL